MKYAIRYRKNFRHFDTIDEVIFTVSKGDESIIKNIPNIVKEKQQKITLEIIAEKPLEEIIPFILQLKNDYPNILVQIPFPFNMEDVNLLKDNQISFMASSFHGYCKDLETVYTMKQIGVSEIYVVEGLGFYLEEVKKILEGTNIKIRVIPNVTQCALGTRHNIPTEHKFQIRPEDTHFYEPYIDIFELFNEDDTLSVTYEVYKNQVWKGYLSDLILDAEDLKIPGDAIPPYFGQNRVNCKQRCLFGTCDSCGANFNFAKAFSKTDYGIIYPKTKEERGKDEFKTN